MNQIKILDVKIDVISKNEVLDKIKDLLTTPSPPLKSGGGQGKQLITTNPEFILEAQKDAEFKNIINNSWLSVADGYGVRLASKYCSLISNFQFPISNFQKFFIGLKVAWWGITRNNKKLDVVKEIITGTDLVSEIIEIEKLRNEGIRFFLLGGYGDTSRLAAEKLKKQFNNSNNLTINYFVFETDNIIEKINNFQPDILFVALNHPQAQIWINNNLNKMPSVKLAIGVGGAFDYISGKIKRAPKKIWGYEWLFRLFKQPKRFKRIFNASIKFPFLIFTKSQGLK